MAESYVEKSVGVIWRSVIDFATALAERDKEECAECEKVLREVIADELERSFRNGKRWAWAHPNEASKVPEGEKEREKRAS
jgi:hypothetical protein